MEFVMNTKPSSLRVLRFASRCAQAAAAAGALAAAACSSGPAGEASASTREAYTAYEAVSITSGQFNQLMSGIQLSLCNFTVTNGQGVFTPSPGLVNDVWGNNETPSQHLLDVTIPSFSVNAPDPLGPYDISVTSLQTSTTTPLNADLEGSDIHVQGVFSGTLHASSGNVLQPGFDVQLTNVTVDVYIALTSSSLTLDHMNVTAQATATGCFLGTVCNTFLQTQLLNIGSQLQNALQPYIQQEISTSAVYGGFSTALLQYAALAESSTGGTGWELGNPLPTIQNSTIDYEVYGTLPPYAPQCFPAETREGCSGSIDVICDPNPDTMVLYKQINGAWVEQSQGGPDLGVDYPGIGTFTYRVCSADAAGSSCTAPFTFTSTAATGCGGSSGAGGSSSGGCPHHVCLQ
jgi:hypothetical protein